MRATSAVAAERWSGCERQSFGVEIIDGQVAVGMNDDGPRAFLHGLRVDAIGQSLLDDDGVGEITFRLRKQITNGHGFARATSCPATRRVGVIYCPWNRKTFRCR